jgi:hypothetical protein
VAVDGVKDFLPMNRDFFRCIDSEADFVSSDFDDYDSDVIVDDNALVFLPGKD